MTQLVLTEVAGARELLERALDEERLDWAALAVAMLEHPSLEVRACERRLDELAARVRRLQTPFSNALAQAQALRKVLAEEEGYGGAPEDLNVPETSFLDQVLQSRRGRPLTLSILYLEVARRCGMPFFAVAFPGHVLIACESAGRKLVMDPHQGGEILTEEGCGERLSQIAPQLKFTPRMLVPASVRTLSSRLLTTLRRLYLARGDGERALRAVDLLLVVSPDHPGALRSRANILSDLGAFRAALADVERCLELSPGAPDHVNLRLAAGVLRQRVDFLN